MSAFIVDNKTISAIIKGFIEYGVDYRDGKSRQADFIILMDKERKRIGQSLLNQNYASVNDRYREDIQTPDYEYEDVDIDEGIIYGCLACYNYQSCETKDYFESEIYKSLKLLKERLLERLLRRADMKAPYGYDGHNMLDF